MRDTIMYGRGKKPHEAGLVLPAREAEEVVDHSRELLRRQLPQRLHRSPP